MMALDAARLERITDSIQARLNKPCLSCAEALVWQAGQRVYHRQLGWADVEKGAPLAPGEIYRLASMTKPIVAVAVMQQVEQGRIDLDEPVSTYIPTFGEPKLAVTGEEGRYIGAKPANGPIRIRHLLTHSSGLGSGEPYTSQLEAEFSPRPGETLADAAPRYGRCPLEYEPGTKSSYSGMLAFDTLAHIVERVSGLSFSEYLRLHLFEPLDMPDTRFALSEEQKRRLVKIYAETPTGIELVDLEGKVFGFDSAVYNSGGGGLHGTCLDYSHFAEMLLREGQYNGRRVLSEASVREMRRPQLAEDTPGLGRGVNWGLGMRVITDAMGDGKPLSAGSFGWSGAFGTHFWIDPAQELFAVYCSNMTTAGGSGAATAFEFERDVYAALG